MTRARGFWARPVGDIVVVSLTFTACAVLVMETVFLIVFALTYPEKDIPSLIRSIAATVNILFGALVGYVAGTRTKHPDPAVPVEE